MSKAAGLFLVFLFTGWFSDLTGISRNNSLKKEAEAAFKNKQYAIAANAWAQIVNETGAPDPGIRLNLAHAYYLQNQNN